MCRGVNTSMYVKAWIHPIMTKCGNHLIYRDVETPHNVSMSQYAIVSCITLSYFSPSGVADFNNIVVVRFSNFYREPFPFHKKIFSFFSSFFNRKNSVSNIFIQSLPRFFDAPLNLARGLCSFAVRNLVYRSWSSKSCLAYSACNHNLHDGVNERVVNFFGTFILK